VLDSDDEKIEEREEFDSFFLIGYRGTGKTSVARILAPELDWEAIDADEVLEKQAGRSIREIFTTEGEPFFRELESRVLKELCAGHDQVVATGGGVVLSAKNRQLLRASGWVIWLTADAQTIWNRLQKDPAGLERRPALTVGGLEEVQNLLQERQPLYDACAGLIVDTTKLTPAETAQVILEAIENDTLQRQT
jgi:shikimate kinase